MPIRLLWDLSTTRIAKLWYDTTTIEGTYIANLENYFFLIIGK